MDTKSCLVGRLVKSKCSEHLRMKTETDIKDLSEDELKSLKYRIPNFPQYPMGMICPNHYYIFLVNYAATQNKCSYPLSKHKTEIRSSLREISLDLCENFLKAKSITIPPGNKVCTNCLKSMMQEIHDFNSLQNKTVSEKETVTHTETRHESQISISTNNSQVEHDANTPTSTGQSATDESLGFLTESQEQNLKMDKLKRLLNVVDVPLAKRPKLYGERLEKWSGEFAQTVCNQVVDQINKVFQTNVNMVEIKASEQDKKSLKSMLSNIKSVYDKQTSPSEKIKLLTLFPTHWTYKDINQHVECSSYMVRKANRLRQNNGVLEKPERKKFLHYSEEFVHSIEQFYRNNGRVIPGAKDCELVYNRLTKQNEMVPQRLLLCTVKELYDKWIQAHLQDYEKIPGFSFFASIKPTDCKLAGAPGTHTICVCSEHQNAKLKCRACSVSIEYRQLLDLCVCSVENEECMLHNCPNCPGPKAIRDFLNKQGLIKKSGFITYFNWTSVNIDSKNDDETQGSSKVTLREITEDVRVFYDQFIEEIWKLRHHHYVSESQKNYCEYAKNNLEYETGLLMMDFAENYSFIAQDSPQSFYYNNSQATLHPFVLYYRDSCGTVKSKSFCVVSDYLKHNAYVVNVFQEKVIKEIKVSFPWIKKLIYFSDGAPTQYKNKNTFSNICAHEKDFGIKVESYNFFATSHGKGPCDGIGAVAKRVVRDASLKLLPPAKQILDAYSMYTFLNEKKDLTKYIWVGTQECEARKKKLARRFDDAQRVRNTRGYHYFSPVNEHSAEFKLTSLAQQSNLEIVTKH